MTALMAAPGHSCRQVISLAVPSLKPSQNSPKFSTSDTAMASADALAPGRRRTPDASPDRVVVTMKPVPTTMIRAALRSQDRGKLGRRAKGIYQTELSAFCTEFDTPSAPMKIPTTATTSAIPV